MTLGLAFFCHNLDGGQDFLLVLAGDHGVDVLLLVAELADSADHFQIEGVLVGFLLGRWENDADGAGVLGGQAAGLEIRLVSQLFHGLAHFFLGLAADGRVILAGAGYG